mmetsp:Transcript_31048/g.34623  ORF Transcript_31048/g.34623 Transcript_31048/m.34623 type:complete len:450 (+) Transcript_31048:1-1350(+)
MSKVKDMKPKKEETSVQKTKPDPFLQFAKQNLMLVLRGLDQLVDITGSSVSDVLQAQLSRNRSFEIANIFNAQICEACRSLERVPIKYAEKDFTLLLEEMVNDMNIRKQGCEAERRGAVWFLKQIESQIALVRDQQRQLLEFLTDLKIRRFREDTYDQLQDTFVSRFRKQAQDVSNCQCNPSLTTPNTCVACDANSKSVRGFLKLSKQEVLNHELWKGKGHLTQQAMYNLERILLSKLYDKIFPQTALDVDFSQELEEKGPLVKVVDLELRQKFYHQAPWLPAQQELIKMSLFKAPHDKMRVIVDTWNVLLNYVKPLNGGPDDYLPIMSYIICKVAPKNLLSQLAYISLYTELDDQEEVWFINFLSAVEILNLILKKLQVYTRNNSNAEDGIVLAKRRHWNAASVFNPTAPSTTPAFTRSQSVKANLVGRTKLSMSIGTQTSFRKRGLY